MRDTIENISLLQKQLNDLQLENQVLKNLLDQFGIHSMADLPYIEANDFLSLLRGDFCGFFLLLLTGDDQKNGENQKNGSDESE